MTQDVRDALDTWFEQYEIDRQLHDVPPHAVYAVTVDGRRAVCKVDRGETADVGGEAAAMAHADRHTDLPVPSVLAAREDAFVATWLDGLDDDIETDDPADARALGRGLARLHAATADAFPRPGFPELGPAWEPDCRVGPAESESAPVLAVDDRADWHAAVRAFIREVRAYLATIGWADPADDVLALLDDCPDLFAGAGRPVLCHGNLHPEHAALDRDGEPELAALIDFEHAMVAPAEYDFWRTTIPLFHEPGSGATETLPAFRAGYESVRSLPLGVERRREAWWLVIFVSFLLALDVQNRGIGPDERERAAGTAELISERVGTVRDRRE
ncbi:MAG: phosphotransferase enzyme family protein [Haloplanus sp.]